jgi:hypothetical protein
MEVCPAFGTGFLPNVVEVRTVRTVLTAVVTRKLFHDFSVPIPFGYPDDVLPWSRFDYGTRFLGKLEQFLGVNYRVTEFFGRELGELRGNRFG